MLTVLYLYMQDSNNIKRMGAHRIFFPGVGKFIGVNRIFSGVHFFLKKLTIFFSHRPQKFKTQAKTTKWTNATPQKLWK